jgi:hypothetical protein
MILLAAASTLRAASEAHAGNEQYELIIDSHLQIKSPGQTDSNEMSSLTVLRYSVTREANVDEVSIGGMQVKVDLDGRTIMNSRMDRTGARFHEGDQNPTDVPYDRAPDPLKKLLAQFDVPAACITLGPDGGETGREILLERESSLIENGVVENARLFHAPFPGAQTEWESPAKISMGTGHFSQGTLKYVKGETDARGLVEISVSGELKADGKTGDSKIRNGVYRVSGRQQFDPSQDRWVSGHLEVNVSLDMLAYGQDTGTATGAMKIRLSRLPTESGLPAPDDGPPAPASSEPASAQPE